MKILFVFRNAEWLGTEYLSSVLKKAGHQTELLFNPGAGDVEFKMPWLEKIGGIDRQIIRRAERYNPDLIAFTALTNIYSWEKNIAAELKKHINAPIIFGGIHATNAPELILKEAFIDMICVGEGEGAIVELADSLENKEVNYDIKNIWFKKDNTVIKNSVRPLIEDLDALPFPDKELFYKYGCFKDRLYVMTGRGCPFSCTYCYNSSYKELYFEKGKYLRRRSVDNVIEEILFFREKYPIKEIFFYDDIFTLNYSWLEEFAGTYKKKIDLPYKCLIHFDMVNEDAIKLLSESGCKYVDIGIESGNEEIRKKILNRRTNNSQIEYISKLLHKHKIPFTALNMVGLPSENKAQMWDTINLNIKIKPNSALFNTFYPFPNTKLAVISKDFGYIDDNIMDKINNGEKSYRESTLLNHPEAEFICWVSNFAPLAVKCPQMIFILKYLKPNIFFRLVAIFFSSPLRNIYFRTKEVISMYVKARGCFSSKR